MVLMLKLLVCNGLISAICFEMHQKIRWNDASVNGQRS